MYRAIRKGLVGQCILTVLVAAGLSRERGVAEEPLFERATEAIAWTQYVGGRKQVFLDDALIVEHSGISKIVGRPTKHVRNPIIVADKPWEKSGEAEFHGVQLHGQTVFYDVDERLFKMWYNGEPLYSTGVEVVPWCYATSEDGVHWEKPSLGIVDIGGSKNNNVVSAVPDTAFMGVMKTVHEADRGRRYKAIAELESKDASKQGVGIAFSEDGLHWTMYEGNPVIAKGPDFADASVPLGWDPRIRKYVFYPRPGRPNCPQWPGTDAIRSIGYAESEDLVRWTPPRAMLMPGDGDRVDSEYMVFNASYDESTGMYVGLLPIHSTHDQTWEIYLLSSRDGFRWTWVDRGRPFLAKGEAGSYDGGYMHSAAPIVHDGTVWFFYGAYPNAHALGESQNQLGRLPSRNDSATSIALATMPADRYVGMLAGARPGVVSTRPLRFIGSKLCVDVDASLPISPSTGVLSAGECQFRVAILDESGNAIPGFTANECDPIIKSGRHEVHWNGSSDLGTLKDRRVRLRFEFRHAALYSFQFCGADECR